MENYTVTSTLKEVSAKETLYHLTCFFYVQKVSTL